MERTAKYSDKSTRAITSTGRNKTFVLNVTLIRPQDACKEEKELSLTSAPYTVADLQEEIQKQFSIPAFDQKLMFGPATLSCKESLNSYSLRSGDSITVEYTSEADVEMILDNIRHIKEMHDFLQSLWPHLSLYPISEPLQTLLQSGIDFTKLDAFPALYHTSTPERRTANCLFFVKKGGLRAIQELHSLLHTQPWKRTNLQTQLLENSLNRLLWTLVSSGADAKSQAAAVSSELNLENIVRSFLRVATVPDTAVILPQNNNMQQYQVQHQVMIATELILNALGTLTCALEFDLSPEQLSLVTTPQFLKQVMGFLLCPSFPPIAQPMAMSILVLITYNQTIHSKLCKPPLINGLIRSWNKMEALQNVTETERIHFKYLMSVVIAQLCTTRLGSLPQSTELAILLKDFLTVADYKEIYQWEKDNGYSWKKFLPYLRVIYHPKRSMQAFASDECHRKFHEMCVEASIFSLQLIMSGEKERKMIEEEGLLDYIVCLPAILPEKSSAQQRAKDLVAMLSKEMHLKPPSLNTMARVRLAVTHFGLERVLKTPAQELLSDVYPSL